MNQRIISFFNSLKEKACNKFRRKKFVDEKQIEEKIKKYISKLDKKYENKTYKMGKNIKSIRDDIKYLAKTKKEIKESIKSQK